MAKKSGSGSKRNGNDKLKDSFMAQPVENHETAAWIANWEEVLPESKVLIPTEFEVHNAKEWVDSNQL